MLAFRLHSLSTPTYRLLAHIDDADGDGGVLPPGKIGLVGEFNHGFSRLCFDGQYFTAFYRQRPTQRIRTAVSGLKYIGRQHWQFTKFAIQWIRDKPN